jgi:hypothetical protein
MTTIGNDPVISALINTTAGRTVGGKRRVFNFLESAPIKAFASL